MQILLGVGPSADETVVKLGSSVRVVVFTGVPEVLVWVVCKTGGCSDVFSVVDIIQSGSDVVVIEVVLSEAVIVSYGTAE